MLAAGAVLAPVALTTVTAPAADAAPVAMTVSTPKKHKSWSQRHMVGLKAVAVARKQIGKPRIKQVRLSGYYRHHFNGAVRPY